MEFSIGVFFIAFLSVNVDILCNPKVIGTKDTGRIDYPNKLAKEKLLKKTKDFWRNDALKEVNKRLRQKINFNTAKNVILFIGDGMSLPTIAATRLYMGGEELSLSFENFPYTGLAKTYCVDQPIADSACSATAYLGGAKANSATMGVTAAVKQFNCTAMNLEENQVDSLAKLFQLKGKRTGLVTNTRVTHSTPGGLYCHTAYRKWESDTDVLKYTKTNPNKLDISQCTDTAAQLIYGSTGQNLNVILGGGTSKFLPNTVIDDKGFPGKRTNRTDLIKEWKRIKENKGMHYEYMWNRKQLLNVKNDTDYLLGLFGPTHLSYNLERNKEMEPSLEEMTVAALKVLNKESNGFFLFVEGGRIDQAHHLRSTRKAIDETAEFSKAVEKAMSLVNENETLIVVTADHSQIMSYAGFGVKDSKARSLASTKNRYDFYSLLSYTTGPGYSIPRTEEINPETSEDLEAIHGAEDVTIYAKGPWSHLFTGVMEESVIYHLISFAACVGSDIECGTRSTT